MYWFAPDINYNMYMTQQLPAHIPVMPMDFEQFNRIYKGEDDDDKVDIINPGQYSHKSNTCHICTGDLVTTYKAWIQKHRERTMYV